MRDYGGTCVNRGCVPKKLYVYGAGYGYGIEDARRFGWQSNDIAFDWATLRDNVAAEVARLAGIYERNLGKAGVETRHGRARLIEPHTIAIGDERISAGRVLIATGGRPRALDIPGGELALSSDDIFTLERLPAHMTIVGAGYIGVEFAHIMAGLGVSVTLVHHRPLALRGFDEDVRVAVTEGLRQHGVELVLEEELAGIERSSSNRLRVALRGGRTLETGAVLSAIGREPNTAGIGLEECGVALGERGEILVDDWSQTSVAHIHAVGDCTDRMGLTPVAIREGQAYADSVFGDRPTRVDYDQVPTAVFSSPPSATVGWSEEMACEKLARVDIYRTGFRPMRNTISGRPQRTMMKLVVDGDSQRVVGVHMVGDSAAEIIQCMAIALRAGVTKSDFDATVALHPTTAEELVFMRKPVRQHGVG